MLGSPLSWDSTKCMTAFGQGSQDFGCLRVRDLEF